MMQNPSKFWKFIYLKRQINKQRIINAVYVILFSYLVLYSILTTLYLENGPTLQYEQPSTYDIENVAVRPVYCTFTISGQYQRTPRYICYVLLIFTIIIRNHEWLAAGAAASVMTYSGVAAIHYIMYFATDNMFNPPKVKTYCERLPVPRTSDPFYACAGVSDPDASKAVDILGSVMLGALPMSAISNTFRKSSGNAILTFWLLLLAVGHTFANLVLFDPNYHFQICPKDNIEPLPGTDFQPPLLDQSWRDSFHSLVSNPNQSFQSLENKSSLTCIYSCFATTGYIGRRTQDIRVIGLSTSGPFIKTGAQNRSGGIVFWWVYTCLAFFTLFTTVKRGLLPKWVHRRVSSLEYCEQALASSSTWRNVSNMGISRSTVSNPSSSEMTSPRTRITILTIFQFFTQFASVVAFAGSVIYLESNHDRGGINAESEPFAAVGQWSNLAVVLLVLLAAAISRIWGGSGDKDMAAEPRRLEDWRISEDGNVEREREDWDWRVGYAS